MVARMNAHVRLDIPASPRDRDAEILAFPVDEWDRLDRWARRQARDQDRALRARNAALARI
jgi:hypothetical protein